MSQAPQAIMDLDEGIKHLDLHGPGSSADENDTDPKNKRDPVTQCFSNRLIMDCLLEYLDFSSTKMFSQTCQSVLSQVRSNRAFIDKSIFCIGNGARSVHQSVLDMAFLRNVNFPWTSMRIEANSLDNAGIDIVTNLLSRVIRLELSKCASGRICKGSDVYRILIAGESLEELVINESYLKMTELVRKSFRSNPKLQTILEHLDVLHIQSEETKLDYKTFMLPLGETVKALLGMPKYLKSFSFESGWAEAAFVKSLLTLIKKHTNTLTSLTLHRWAWDTDDVLDLVCPNLKELNVTARGEDLPRVCQFIMKQGQLLKLNVNLDSGTTLSSRPLADTLILRGSLLVTFSLAWKLDPPRAYLHVPGTSLDFSWLQKLSKLKNITIRQFTGTYADSEARAPVSHILANLPAGIKIINLAGAFLSGLEIDEAKKTQLMIENLGGFRDLTVLNLLKCPNALNDDILLFISSNLTQLRELGFAFSNAVTRRGFTGIGALKALVKLKLYQYNRDWNHEIQEIMLSFSFPELKELHLGRLYDYWLSTSDQGQEAEADYFKKLVNQNRMLEKLVVHIHTFVCTLEDDLKEHFGRIIRVEKMDLEEFADT